MGIAGLGNRGVVFRLAARDLCCLQDIQTGAMASSVYWSTGTRDNSPVVKPQGRETDPLTSIYYLYFVNAVFCTHITHFVSPIDEIPTSPTVDSYFYFSYFFSVQILNHHLGFLKSTDFQKDTFRITHIGGRLFTFFAIKFYFAFDITDCV